MEQTEFPTPGKDFNPFVGWSDWPAPSSQMSEIGLLIEGDEDRLTMEPAPLN